MENFAQLLKVGGLRMVPFFKTVALFFVLNTHHNPGHAWSTILKCVPIYCLMVFVLLSGFSLRKEHYFSQRILLGLLFSSFGDALLNHDLFPHGMGAFAVAQIFYISAFGLRPLKPWIPLVLYSIGGFMVYLIFENLPDIIQVGLPVYGLLLLGMVWRAIARLDGEYSNITKLAAAIGGFVFAVSDSIIAIDMFYSKVPHAKLLIMVTYYIAQFGITLSILDLSTEAAIRHKSAKKTDRDVAPVASSSKATVIEGGVRQRGSGSTST